MAVKKTAKTAKAKVVKTEIPDGLKSAFTALKKMNIDSAPLADNALSIVKDWIDTGSYSLNAIISGSVYKGIPKGRITGLAGPSGCGKTLIVNQIIANAQRKDPDVWAVVWDSENAFDAQMAKNLGIDINKVRHCPIESVEDCRNQMTKLLDNIALDKSLHGKVIIILDSLGNLASTKELADATAGKSAQDMGSRARSIKSMMRVLTNKCAKTNTTFVFTNHTYEDPSALFPSIVQNQSGGKAPIYLASVLVQLALKQEKTPGKKKKNDSVDDVEDDVEDTSTNETSSSDEIIAIANKVMGITMSAMTIKNRFVPTFLKSYIYLNFKSGLYKYAGLLEMALAYNVIQQNGAVYSMGNEKLGFYKNWKDNADLWEKEIIPVLDKIIQKEFTFSNEALEEIEYNEEQLLIENNENDEDSE